MKVVQLGPYPPPHGGVQTNLVAIREYLRRNGHACDAVNLTRFRRDNSDGVYYPEERRRVDAPAVAAAGGHSASALRRRPDAAASRRWRSSARCSRGRKTVLTFHSGGYPGSPAGRTAAPRTLRGFVMRRLDGLIAVNPEIAALFGKFGVPAANASVPSCPSPCPPPDRGLAAAGAAGEFPGAITGRRC